LKPPGLFDSGTTVPTRLQYQTTECGVAVIAMMMAHYGRNVPMEEIRKVTGVSRDCLNASDIVRSGRAFGFSCSGHRIALEDLRTEPTPFIAHLNFIHFVVVEEVRGDRVLINDPAVGQSETDIGLLDSSFTGIIVRFRPHEDAMPVTPASPPGSPATTFAGLWARAGGLTRLLAVLAVFAGTAEAAAILMAARTLAGSAEPTLRQAVAAGLPELAMAGLLLGLACAFRMSASRLIEERLARSERTGLIDLLLGANYRFLNYRLPGDMYKSLADTGPMMRHICATVLPASTGIVVTIMLLAGMTRLNGPAAAATAGLLSIAAIALIVVNRRQARRSRGGRIHSDPDLAALAADIKGIEASKTGGRDEDFVTANLGSLANRMLSGHAGTSRNIVEEVATRAAGWLIVTSAGLAALVTNMTGAESVALLLLAGAMALWCARWRGALAAFDHARHMLMHADDLRESAGISTREKLVVPAEPPVPDPGLSLQMRAVTFGHSGTRPPLVSEIDLDIPTGAQVGITGPSGGGKSSLGALAAGLHVPWSGSIATRRGEDVGRDVIWVDKSVVLFDGSLRDNLTLFDETIDDRAIRDALDAVHLSDVVAAREGGIDCHVEARGRNFSGGQAQRIEIARAILHRPSTIILDEALDALNPTLERIIRDNLRRAGISLLIISHRASTLEACDRLLELRDGRLCPQSDLPGAGETAPVSTSTGAPAPDGQPDKQSDAGYDAAFAAIAALSPDKVQADIADVPATGDAIADSARRQGLLVRRIRLRLPRWWRMALTPFAGHRRETGEPVAIRPLTNRYAVIGDETGAPRDLVGETGYAAYPRHALDNSAVSGLLGRPDRQFKTDVSRAMAMAVCMFALIFMLPWLGETASILEGKGVRITVTLAGYGGALALFGAAALVAMARLSGRCELGVMSRLFQRIARLSPAIARKSRSEQFGRALAVPGRFFAMLRDQLPASALSLPVLAGGLAALLLTAPVAGLAAALALVAILAATIPVAALSRSRSRDAFTTRLNSQRFLVDLLRGLGRLRCLGREHAARDKWLDLLARQDGIGRQIAARDGATMLVLEIVTWSAALLVPLAADAQDMTAIATTATLLWLCLLTLPPMTEVIRASGAAAGFLPDLRWLLRATVEPGGRSVPASAAIAARNLEFSHIKGAPPAVRDLSIEVEPGRILAIAGPSGSGKSTLLRLLLGFETPDKGEITISGVPFAEIDPLHWRYGIGLVQQGDRIEQAASLRSHVTGFGRYDLADAERAVQLAELAEMINALPMGMQTILERDKFSTGQEQRLLLARALVRNPSLLVLDEATNAIPDSVQARIFSTIRSLGLTCILVTHRESALRQADRIAILRDGAIDWSGTGEELMSRADLRAMLALDRKVEVKS
jgi:ABC-type bacteriocin/lantibiotic exporter with double-glycine peptidase domain